MSEPSVEFGAKGAIVHFDAGNGQKVSVELPDFETGPRLDVAKKKAANAGRRALLDLAKALKAASPKAQPVA
jgi:hypothetical protein